MAKEEMKSSIEEIVQKAIREISADPNHPNRAAQEVIAQYRNIFGSDAALVHLIADYGKRIQEAYKESALILELIETTSIAGFYFMPPVSGFTLLAVAARIDEKTRAKAESMQKLILSTRLSPEGRKKGGQARQVAAQPNRKAVKELNAYLLSRPSNEGWGSVKERAHHIAEKTGLKFSYVRALIATPRKTKQA